eukprot:Sdes_comp16817_c0_seq1m6064
MAKWGEGDPRWIVEERADATNVNNWHWTEKNCFPWSKKRLIELFSDFKVEVPSIGSVWVTEVENVAGECTANNRKAKLIFFYEMELKVKWKGTVSGGETATGEAFIPNLSEENEWSEIEWEVTTKTNSDAGRKLKDLFRRCGEKLCREKIKIWLSELKQEQVQGMVLPTDKKIEQPIKTSANSNSTTSKEEPSSGAPKKLNSASNGANNDKKRVECRDFEDTINFRCSTDMLYDILTDTKRVESFTQSSASMNAKVGGKFSMFGGNIHGEYVELKSGQKIVKKWRSSSWPDGYYSLVTMTFKQESDSMQLHLVHKGVPVFDYERTVSGWNNHYWRKIKVLFGMEIGSF